MLLIFFLILVFILIFLWITRRSKIDESLAGGVGTLPLAPLAAVKEPELPAVIRRMKERVSAEAPPGEEAVLWTATYVLMGLRYDEALADELLRGVLAMEESVTYQAIIRKGKAEGRAEGEAKGRAEGAQRILVRIGTKALGNPDAETTAAIAR